MLFTDKQRRAFFWRLNNNIFSERNAGIISGSDRENIAMLSKLETDPKEIDRLCVDDDWVVCDKYDGIRTFAVVNGDKVELFNPRKNSEYAWKFSDISKDLLRLFKDHQPVILDGEIRCIRNGKDDVHGIVGIINTNDHERIKEDVRRCPPEFVVFDMMEFEDSDISGLPLEERLGVLSEVVGDGSKSVSLAKCAYDDKKKFVEDTLKDEKEGVVFKDLGSDYEFGRRSSSWVKYKKSDSGTFVVYGMERGSGKNSDKMGALLIGRFEDGKFVESGKVGTGFSEAERKRLWDKYGSAGGDRVIIPENVRFGVDVKFLEPDTKGGLRNPTVEKIREDLGVSSMMSKSSDTTGSKERMDVKLWDDKLRMTYGGETKMIPIPRDPVFENDNLRKNNMKQLQDGFKLTEFDLIPREKRLLIDLFEKI